MLFGEHRKREDMAHTIEKVKARVQELKVSDVSFTGKELNVLAEILKPDEYLHTLTKGQYNNGVGLLCTTSMRILFIDKGLFSLKVEEFPLKSVSSISFESGLIFGTVKIFASGNNGEIKNAPKGDAKMFVDITRKVLDERDSPKDKAPTISEAAAPVADIYEQIEKLAGLKEKGIITEAEFQAKKTQMLGI